MRSTFNILFYVNKSKEKNGVVPVMGRERQLCQRSQQGGFADQPRVG